MSQRSENILAASAVTLIWAVLIYVVNIVLLGAGMEWFWGPLAVAAVGAFVAN